MVLHFLAKAISKSCEAAHAHPHREVLTFDDGGRDMRPLLVAYYVRFVRANEIPNPRKFSFAGSPMGK
jgi:hypothetical protein